MILSGELSVLFNLGNDGLLKIQQWKFTCHGHDEYIARSHLTSIDSPVSIPKKKLKSNPKPPNVTTPHSLVNPWGFPERIYQLLRVNTQKKIIFSLFSY